MRFQTLKADQIVALLAEVADGVPLTQLAKTYGVSTSTIWNWRRYSGLSADWIIHVRTVELRNQQLARSLAISRAQVFAAAGVIKALEPSRKRRALFAAAMQVGTTVCRTRCNQAVGLSLATRPSPDLAKRDAALVKEMRRYVAANPGVGFANMFQVLLQDRGCTRNHALDLYNESKLKVKQRTKRPALPSRLRRPHTILGKRDAMWAVDYMTHTLTSGLEFFVLNCVDEYTRECVISRAFPRYGAAPTVQALEVAMAGGRKPTAIRSDNGGEFTAAVFAKWSTSRDIARVFNRPGHPEDNVIVERFNGTMRKEVLNWYTFETLDEVQPLLDDYRARYNVGRPHVSLGGLSPLQFAYLAASQPNVAAEAHTPGTRLASALLFDRWHVKSIFSRARRLIDWLRVLR